MSRLGNAYRVTQDLDALRRRLEGAASGLKKLRAAGAKDINEIGGLVPSERGDVRVDVLEEDTTTSIATSLIPRIDLRRWRISGHWTRLHR